MHNEFLVMTRLDGGRRFPKIRLRCWSSTPDGGRIPTRYGLNFDSKDLPNVAGLFARALDLEMRLRPRWAANGTTTDEPPSGNDAGTPDCLRTTTEDRQMSYIDSAGFHRTSRSEILANLQASYQGLYGATADFSEGTPDGKFLGIFADAIDEATGLLETAYRSCSPSSAIGAALARLSLINGLKRETAQSSSTLETLTGTPGTVIPAGSLIGNVTNPTAIYATDSLVTIGSGGTVDVSVTATTTGAVPGAAGDISKILTVIPGWATATNAADVSQGNGGETDVALRIRRAASVALPSQGIVDGLEATLLALPNVTQVRVRENPEDTTQILPDGGTLVAHAVEVMVVGGDTTDIANAIWLKKSMGVTTVGGHTETVLDTQGFAHDINFDIPGEGIIDEPVYVAIHATPALGSGVQTAIQNAIVAWSEGLLQLDGTILQVGQAPTGPVYPPIRLGGGVRWSQIFAPINSVGGAVFITEVDLGLTASPTLQTDIPAFYNQLPTFSVGNITFP